MKTAQMIREAKQLMKKLEANRLLYKRMDEITFALRKTKGLEKHGLSMVDNFANGNTAFRATAIRRFELKRVKE